VAELLAELVLLLLGPEVEFPLLGLLLLLRSCCCCWRSCCCLMDMLLRTEARLRII